MVVKLLIIIIIKTNAHTYTHTLTHKTHHAYQVFNVLIASKIITFNATKKNREFKVKKLK